jgi:hypothetical protein
MLKVLAQISAWRDSEPARIGATALLDLWESRKMRRPYLFALGTDFAKLKAPLIWFDVLHVLDVLTQFPWLWGDPRLLEMIEVVRAKADAHGRFTPESVWLAWKGWDFGQKRAPSEWLTFLVLRMLQRHATSVTYVSGCRGFGEVCSGSAGVSPAKGAGDAREPALPGSAAKE